MFYLTEQIIDITRCISNSFIFFLAISIAALCFSFNIVSKCFQQIGFILI